MKWHSRIVGVVALLALLAACARPQYQEMSASGYLWVLEDGEGTTQFSVENDGDVYMAGDLDFDGTLDVDGTVDLDDVNIAGALDVDGATTVDGFTASELANLDAGIAVDTNAFTVADTSGNTVIAGTLDVDGATTVDGFTASELANLDAGIAVDTSAFTVADATGDTVISGTLVVTDAVTLASTLDVDGATTVDGFTAAEAAALNANVTLGDAIGDSINVYGQMRSYDGSDNWADISDVSALGRGNGWHAAYNITGWGGGGQFQALFANTQIVTDTTVSIYGLEAKSTYKGAVGSGDSCMAYGLFGKVTAKDNDGTHSVIPKAYPIYSILDVAASNTITEAVNFMAENANSGTEDASYILKTHSSGDTWDYGIHMGDATINTAEIVGSNGETLGNTVDGLWTFGGAGLYDGIADAIQLRVQGYTVQSNNPDLLVVETSAGTDLFAVNNSGVVDIDGSVTVDQTGTGNQVYSTITSNSTAAARALRGKAQATSGTTGDLIGVYGIATVDTTATVQDASTVAAEMNWAEVLQASGTVTVCATGDGCVFAAERNIVELAQDMIGVSGRAAAISYNEAYNNATGGALHYGVFVLNNQQTGNANIGAAFAAQSGDHNTDGGADFNYILDADTAVLEAGGAEIRGTNGETLSNATDTTWVIGGFTTPDEQTAEVVTSGSTIVATGTYQPITSAGVVTTSDSTAIADGTVNGQILIIVNENASDAITVKNGANTHLSADIVLGNDDTLGLMWDGADWLELFTSDNS